MMKSPFHGQFLFALKIIMPQRTRLKAIISSVEISWSLDMDSLSSMFEKFSLSARVFFSGRLCGVSGDHATETAGHLHLLRRGKLTVERPDGERLVVTEPSVLFYPQPCRHRLWADEANGAEIVCAHTEFGVEMQNPLVRGLPELLVVPLSSVKELEPAIELLFGEAMSEYPGRQAAINRLAEYAVVLLFRAAMREQLLEGGVLMGLMDARLAKAIAAMHEYPEHAWSLEALAGKAQMSRARFAVHFRQVVGVTPFEYLTDWRIGVAQTLLKKGEPLKVVAPLAGYASSTALTRVFCQRVGMSPTEWMMRNRIGQRRM
jgi:AraC-like DNA-binding protein